MPENAPVMGTPPAEDPSAAPNRLKLELWQLELRYEGFRIRAPGKQGRMLASLAEHGQQSPVLVVADCENHYVLIDGYRRVQALRKLDSDTVEVLVLPMGEAEALVYGLRSSRGTKRSALEEGWWIRELVEHHKFTLDRISVNLERSTSWVSRRLALVQELPESVQIQVRRGRICPHAAMRYLVPLARANKGACQRITQHIGNSRLSARQVGTLYVAWRRADRQERTRLEENPLLYLKALEEWERDPAQAREVMATGTELFKDLEIVTRICHRLRRVLPSMTSRNVDKGFWKKLDKRWQETQLAVDTLKITMEEVVHARHRRAQDDS